MEKYNLNNLDEIINNYYTLEENMAELSAILNIEAEIGKKDIKVYTENIGVSRRIYTLNNCPTIFIFARSFTFFFKTGKGFISNMLLD